MPDSQDHEDLEPRDDQAADLQGGRELADRGDRERYDRRYDRRILQRDRYTRDVRDPRGGARA